MRTLLLPRLSFAALLVAVTWMTLTPDPQQASAGFDIARLIAEALFGDGDLSDKVAHFGAYVALGVSAALALPGAALLAIPGLAAYGAALEGLQALGGVREPEALDAFANALGAAFGVGAVVGAALLARRTAR
jgi:hypothetical protein